MEYKNNSVNFYFLDLPNYNNFVNPKVMLYT